MLYLEIKQRKYKLYFAKIIKSLTTFYYRNVKNAHWQYIYHKNVTMQKNSIAKIRLHFFAKYIFVV